MVRFPPILAEDHLLSTSEPGKPSKKAGWLRRVFVRGLVALLPTMATIALLYLLLDFFYRIAAKPLGETLRWLLTRFAFGVNFLHDHPQLSQVLLVVVGFLIALALFAALGLLVRGLFGKRLFATFENFLLQLPGVRAIYPHAKQIVQFFFDKKKPAFKAVVAVPYPYPEVYAIGFVTSDGLKSLNEKMQGKFVSVFIPASPMPMTGWIAFVPREKVVPLPISVEEAFRFIVSAGVIRPEQERVNLGKESFLRTAPLPKAPGKKE